MKNLSTALSALALIGVLVLFGMHFSGNKSKTSNGTTKTVESFNSTGRIAYVNIDSLEANYTYLKEEREKFEKRQAAMRAELQRSADQMQNDLTAVQRKAQAGTLTQAEEQAAQKRLGQMQQTIETRKESLQMQLMKDQEDFNKQLQNQLDEFLAEYNKEAKYDYILSYAKGGSIMFANKSLDITQDVLKGMNARPRPTGDAETKNK